MRRMLDGLKVLVWIFAGVAALASLGLITQIVPGTPTLLQHIRDVAVSPWWAILLLGVVFRSALSELILQLGKRFENSGLTMTVAGARLEIAAQQEPAASEAADPTETPISEIEPVNDLEEARREIQRLKAVGLEFSYQAWAERIYRFAFGSQLSFLEFLKSQPDNTTTKSATENGYYKTLHLDRSGLTPFANWLIFLESYTLIDYPDEETIRLTANGEWFVNYAAANGMISLLRPL